MNDPSRAPERSPYPLAARAARPQGTIVELPGGVRIGGDALCLVAGPCAVESEAQVMAVAAAAATAGAALLRGGAFKPRTSPYAFRGLGEAGLRLLAAAGRAHGLPTVSEAVDHASAEAVAAHADMIQIGARNMHNHALLEHVATLDRPVMLKRGLAATIEEWLLAAECLLRAGCERIVLCERGVRGFDPATRNVLDLAAIPLVRRLSHLPIIADPSHGTGRRDLVAPMALAAAAAGAHGVMVEVHPNPAEALSDGQQALEPDALLDLARALDAVARATGRSLARDLPRPG